MPNAKASDVGKNLIKSVQTLTVSFNAKGTFNYPITWADPAKSYITFKGSKFGTPLVRVRFTSPTNIEVYNNSDNVVRNVSFDILEYR